MSSRGDFVVCSVGTIGSVSDVDFVSWGIVRWYPASSLESNVDGFELSATLNLLPSWFGNPTSGNRKDGMSAKTRKIVAWTIGMALVGVLVGSMGSYSDVWYEALIDSPSAIVLCASIGLLLGSIFSRNLPASK